MSERARKVERRSCRSAKLDLSDGILVHPVLSTAFSSHAFPRSFCFFSSLNGKGTPMHAFLQRQGAALPIGGQRNEREEMDRPRERDLQKSSKARKEEKRRATRLIQSPLSLFPLSSLPASLPAGTRRRTYLFVARACSRLRRRSRRLRRCLELLQNELFASPSRAAPSSSTKFKEGVNPPSFFSIPSLGKKNQRHCPRVPCPQVPFSLARAPSSLRIPTRRARASELLTLSILPLPCEPKSRRKARGRAGTRDKSNQWL